MEMNASGINNIRAPAVDGIYHALCRTVGLLRSRAGGVRIKSEAERRAENDKRIQNAQALAACWQSARYNR